MDGLMNRKTHRRTLLHTASEEMALHHSAPRDVRSARSHVRAEPRDKRPRHRREANTTGRANKSTGNSLSLSLCGPLIYRRPRPCRNVPAPLTRPPSIHRHNLPLFVIVIGPFIIAMTTRGVPLHATGKKMGSGRLISLQTG